MSEQKADRSISRGVRARQEKMGADRVSMAEFRDPDEKLSEHAPRSRIMDEQFPTDDLNAKSKKDRLMMAQLELADEQGNTPFGSTQLKDEDLKWLLKKQDAAEAANFQAWFAREFDLMSPADKRIAEQLFPEFYAQREKRMKKDVKMLLRVAKTKLHGPRTKQDVLDLYALETGRLDIDALTNILHPEESTKNRLKQNQAVFRRGLASPFRVFGHEAYPENVYTRKDQIRQYATRKWNDDNDSYGVSDFGFPPFSGTRTNQGTADWYKVLGGDV